MDLNTRIAPTTWQKVEVGSIEIEWDMSKVHFTMVEFQSTREASHHLNLMEMSLVVFLASVQSE